MDSEDAIGHARRGYLPTTVEGKTVPLRFDLGHLLAVDDQPVDRDPRSAFLLDLTRDNTQLLMNEIFSLPTRPAPDMGVLVDLPAPTTSLPREKPLPKPKAPTRWEKFAKEQGIKKKKRSRMVFDEQAGDYKPRYGYKRANDNSNDWLIEVPDHADPFEDQFEKRAEEKKKRVEKNKKNQEQNLEKIGRLEKKYVVGSAALPMERDLKKLKLNASLQATKTSTASLGKFDRSIRNDPVKKAPNERKRKFQPVASSGSGERQESMKLVERLLSKSAEPLVNTQKALRQVDPTGSIGAKPSSSSSSSSGKGGKFGKGKKKSNNMKTAATSTTTKKKKTAAGSKKTQRKKN